MVTSYLNEKITDENLIYCSTFQLVWNELIEKFTRGPVELTTPLLTIVEELNKQSFTKDSLSDDCYLTLSGFGKDVVAEITRQLKEKFNETSRVDFGAVSPSDIVLYAFLLKVIQFAKKFDKTSIYWTEKRIKAFGFEDDRPDMELKKQVKILHYNSDDDFSIQLITEKKDILVLAKIEPKNTLEETISYVESLNTGILVELSEKDKLKIPMIDFDIEHHFNEILGKYFSNPSMSEYFIGDAVQLIKFSLNEKGMKLRSEAAMIFSRGISLYAKHLIFDKPFLLYVKEPNGKPYFALWIANTDLLVKEKE